MNYVIFHLNDSRNLRGGERQTLYLIHELKKKGIENYLVVRKNSPIFLKSKEYAIDTLTLPYLFEWDIISLLKLLWLIRRIKKTKKVIIHSHTAHTASIAVLTSLLTDAKVVVHRRVDFKIKANFLSRLKYKKANAIITVSDAIKKILIKNGINEEKIYKIPSSYNKDLFNDIIERENKKENNTITIGSLIALVPHKDPLNLIKAAELCIKENKNLVFLIAGEGELMEKCRELILELKVNDNVKLMGYVKENIKFLKSIDIFVLPSREEGLGSVLIEAMMCGVPIIATDAGGIKEIVKDGHNGIIVPRENPYQLSRAILDLAKDEEKRKRFSRNALEFVKTLNSENMALETINVYERLFKNS